MISEENRAFMPLIASNENPVAITIISFCLAKSVYDIWLETWHVTITTNWVNPYVDACASLSRNKLPVSYSETEKNI